MKSFSQWLLDWHNADPDSIHHPEEEHGGNGVTFKYDPLTDDLEVAPQAFTHYQAFNTDRDSRDHYVLGRTTGKGEHPTGLLAVWYFDDKEAIKKAINKLLKLNYVTDDYEVFMAKKNLGTVKNFTIEDEKKVTINVPGYGEVDIRQIPALLHTLPETSPAKQVVKNFICNNFLTDLVVLLSNSTYHFFCILRSYLHSRCSCTMLRCQRIKQCSINLCANNSRN